MVIDLICKRRREGTCTHVERDLDCLGPLRIQALRQHGDRAQYQGFTEAEFQDADQDEQKVYRQRAGNPWQVHLEPRRQNSDAQVTDELSYVFTGLVDSAIDQRSESRCHDQTDEQLGR